MIRVWLAAVVLLGAVDASAYVQSRTKKAEALTEWNTRLITYRINEVGSDDMDFDTLVAQVALSFAPWLEQSCVEMEVVYEGPTAHGADPEKEIGYDKVNVVVFREQEALWLHDENAVAVTTVSFCEGKGGVCDRAGEIIDADIEVNGAFPFAAGDITPRARFDLRNTLTHEVGHLLGFDHTPEEDATMYASAGPGENNKRTLARDDILAYCEIYATIFAEEPVDEGCVAAPGRAPSGGWLVGLGLLGLAALRRRR